MKKWWTILAMTVAAVAGIYLSRPAPPPEQVELAAGGGGVTEAAPVAGASAGTEAQTAAGVPAQTEAKKMDSGAFRAFTAEVLHALPTRADLQRLSPEEVHHTPKLVVDAGVKMGEIAEILARQPELEGDAFFFYESCATGADYPQSVRALCYFHWDRLGKRLQRQVDSRKVPESVRRVAEQL